MVIEQSIIKALLWRTGMPFAFTPTEIPEVLLVQPRSFPDGRGFFKEMYRDSDFKLRGCAATMVQTNMSHSVGPVLRGLHYQLNPVAQAKLVAVLAGEIFDVAVDIRKGSPTFGKWAARRLSGENHQMLYIPEGFAHGFCLLSDSADIVYQMTAEYAPQLERGIIWNDPVIAVDWPVAYPFLSERDRKLPCLNDAEMNFLCPQ